MELVSGPPTSAKEFKLINGLMLVMGSFFDLILNNSAAEK
jgi:hypothetical protein